MLIFLTEICDKVSHISIMRHEKSPSRISRALPRNKLLRNGGNMIITKENYKQHSIGTKAANLFTMQAHGINVPDLFCTDIYSAHEAAGFAKEKYSETAFFSVRSSALAEDGSEASFAGQFSTYLNVSCSELEEYIRKTAKPVTGQSFKEYCRQNGIADSELHITVIVQKMIDADMSGVIFTANPQGLLNETVVVVGNGTGDNVVEDKVDTTTYYYNTTDKQYYYERKANAPLLNNALLEEIIKNSGDIKELFGHECDIEFAIKDGTLYILQARAITTLTESTAPIVLDNSNIVESYPGITLPLTQSFIKEAYYCVFRSVLLRLTKEKKTVEESDDILRSMVDACNGRVYYRISNWYDIIMFLPFSKKIIPIWQEMLGVKTKTVTAHTDNKVGFITHAKVTFSFFRLITGCPSLMEWLDGYFSDIVKEFEEVDISAVSCEEILKHYQKIKNMVSEKWDITLVNDMYSFIYTGLLKSWLKHKKMPDYKEAANGYISGINGIESMKPVNMLTSLAARAKAENRISELKAIKTNEDYYSYVSDKNDSYTEALQEYIKSYGDRNVNELKLESKTFRTDPVLLVERILQYAADGITLKSESAQETSEQDMNSRGSIKAESISSSSPKADKPRGITGFLAKRAALGIKNREKSRLHRGRLYGMMRSMMLMVGERLTARGQLSAREDIFMLTYEQVEEAVHKGNDMTGLVNSVKRQYSIYEQLPAYSRLVFAGEVFDKKPVSVGEMQFDTAEDVFVGVPCSRGSVEGEVLLVENPENAGDTTGKILVTKMTDPGWVFLIAGARGIVAEKGSLLSHTAIISRELEKPAVVGVDNITRILKSGDYIHINGGTGEIRIIK